MKKNKDMDIKEEKLPDNKQPTALPEDDDERLDIKKSVFQTNREMMAQRQRELDEQQAKIEEEMALHEKKRQEAYDKRIREEKIELMRLKQGIIEDGESVTETETIHEEPADPKKMPLRKKISNFFYHNKWWLGVGMMITLIVGYLIYDYVTKPNPDIIILVVADNDELGIQSDLKGYIQGFTEDENDNGKVQASIYYIHYTDNQVTNYSNGTDSKLTTQFQSADGVIVIGDKKLDEFYGDKAAEYFCDLEELFPDNPHVSGYKFLLKDTPFAERIGMDPEKAEDLYIALRLPRKLLYCSKGEMEKAVKKDLPVLEKIVDDLTE